MNRRCPRSGEGIPPINIPVPALKGPGDKAVPWHAVAQRHSTIPVSVQEELHLTVRSVRALLGDWTW